jgi:hypothetical protein
LALTKAEMTKEGSTGGPADPRAARRQERAERLSAALKANLRRRKAQARDKGEREKEARERAAGQPGHAQGPEPVEAIMDKKAGDREPINRETIDKEPVNGDPMNRAPSGKAP